MHRRFLILLLLCNLFEICLTTDAPIEFDPKSVSLQMGEDQVVGVVLREAAVTNLNFIFTYRDGSGKYLDNANDSVLAPLYPIFIPKGSAKPVNFTVYAKESGRIYLGLNETTGAAGFQDLEIVACDVMVRHYHWLEVLANVVGWIYFLAWTVSFYPQLYLNWKRKSVLGLNFDFLCFNLVGFFVYTVFNVSLYFSPMIKSQYAQLHPIGTIPVFPNDIFFAIHAFAACVLTAIQAIIYERGQQRVSYVCIALLIGMVVYTIINAIIASVYVITWLTFLYNISYIKLFITFIKYIPQAVMNCRRRSTVGWSIGNIMLDLTGGSLSILQMFIEAYNYNDWSNVFGSPTKFGIGLFSVLFDVFFMIQHWILFPHRVEHTDAIAVDTPTEASDLSVEHGGTLESEDDKKIDLS